ncbi:putative NACHT domain-containing protein [Seiridium cardinale]|uniref:NACHT domain-containing protein n=1 Tax=Seiridium cardinale TaxID=138064 RepID=A0ABR2Y9Y7_9PEZI
MDPGTALAVVSLALQVSSGLINYYRLWKDCHQDVQDLRASLLRLEQIFKHLRQALERPDLSSQIVLTICSTCKDCEGNINELRSVLETVKEAGNPKGMLQKLRDKGRRACYPFRASTVLRLGEIIEGLKEDVSLSLHVLSLDVGTEGHSILRRVEENIVAIRNNIDQVGGKVNNLLENQQQSNMLEWLGAPDHSVAHNFACAKCHPGTGSWFIQSEVFESWSSQKGSRLWVNGKSGSGKTILCSTIIESIKKLVFRNQNQRSGHLVYFYFSFDISENYTLISVLKSLISQLCKPGERVPELRRLYTLLFPEAPSQRELGSLLVSILRRLGGRPNEPLSHSTQAEETYFVFDGIDEIPHGSDREAIFKLLQDIAKSTTADHIHMILTSRNESEIARSLPRSQGWLRYDMFHSRIQKDIAAYTSDQIASHHSLKALPMDIKMKIKETLVEGSNGMFRWAALQMDYLKRLRIARPIDVLRVLNSLPHDLSGTYDRILQRIDLLYAEEALRALQWIVFAARPLFLEEVAEACIVDPSSSKAVDPDRRLQPLDIAEILTGLVVVEPPVEEIMKPRPRRHVLALAHFSVKEYLISTQARGLPSNLYELSFEAGLAHCSILRGCMAYIQCCVPRSGEAEHQMALQSYVCNRWPYHASQAGPDQSLEVIEAVVANLTAPDTCQYWIEHSRVYWNANGAPAFVSSHYRRLTQYSNTGAVLDKPQMTDIYPLYHSIAFRLEAVSKVLLARLPEYLINARGTYLLEASVISQTTSIIEPLIRRGANPGGVLKLALNAGNDEASLELLRVGCQPQKDDLAAAAVSSSGAVMEKLMSQIGLNDLLFIVLALNAGLHNRRRSTVELLMKAMTSNHNGSDHEKSPTLFRLLATAIRLDLALVVEELMRWADKFSNAGCSYDDLFRLSAKEGSSQSARIMLSSHAKSKIKYATFSKVLLGSTVRYNHSHTEDFQILPIEFRENSVGLRDKDMDANWSRDKSFRLSINAGWVLATKYDAFFRVLIPHIPTAKNQGGRALRLSIATSDENMVLELIMRKAGSFNPHGTWIDYLALLMASIHDFQSTVIAMQHNGAEVKILRALRNGTTVRVIAEIFLNLAAASRIYMLEPQWNPSVERQAFGRALRLDQTDNVTIIRYVTKGTIEDSKFLSRQNNKLQLALGGFEKHKQGTQNERTKDVVTYFCILNSEME